MAFIVAAHGVHRADGGIKVVEVGLHVAEGGVRLFRALAALEGFALFVDADVRPFSPLDEGPSEVFGRNDVLPFDALGALGVLGRREAVGQRHVLSRVKGGAAVERHAVIEIHLPFQKPFGLREGFDFRVARRHEEGRGRRKKQSGKGFRCVHNTKKCKAVSV